MPLISTILWRTHFTAVLLAGSVLLLVTDGTAQPVRRQAQAAVAIKRSKPTPEEKNAAVDAAKHQLIRIHIATADSARQANLSRIEGQLQQNPDAVLSNLVITGEGFDKKSKTYTVAVAADISDSEIDRMLQALSPAQPLERKLPISLVVVARRQRSVEEIRPSLASGTKDLRLAESSSGESIHQSGSTVSDSRRVETATVPESSVTLHSDSIKYEVAPAQEADAAISSVLGDRGFKVVPADVLAETTGGLFEKKRFTEDFGSGDDLGPKTRADAVKGCQKVGLAFFGFATLTFDGKRTEEVTGKPEINVRIVAEVWDVRDQFPTKVAAVGPVQYQDIGESQTQAENKALIGAANRAANLICDKLIQNGIH